ncbi:PH domain-containing protein [Caldichromatium japonicum]|uniref:PH domain-containing protein n=1 Tax=Caldichromatium japonicum TaxID=2699430 RepID=A0A6G7VE15_9GAMM|nr:PH domain-containing protein [Caldichromatium japonicum]QIK38261.1 PH domain-containing protein [Caldichromatium japonicum]
MSEVLYSAHPSLIRSRPLATVLTLLLLVGGSLLFLKGEQALPPELTLPGLDDLVLRLLGLLLFVFALFRLVGWWLASLSDRLEISADEILWSHGLLSKHYTEISMNAVRTVHVSQSLLQRILNAGDLTIYTSGDLPELVVRGLPDPGRIRALIRSPVRE